jgi:predicted DNA-binding protein (UPF0251 family)/predicted Fe-Mo cluster-binding NifX family protein
MGNNLPREKNKRNLTLKPKYKSFGPTDSEYSGITRLLHEEIEAIYLSDVLGLYQEEAAKSMQTSRPTFTRIVKNARTKLANALISGHKIEIEDTKDEIIIAVCKSDDGYSSILPTEQYIDIYKIDNSITLIDTIDNPVYKDAKKPATILPSIFVEHSVNYFISSKIGEGLKASLIAKGIWPIKKESFSTDINISSLIF